MSIGFKATYAALKTALQIPVINQDGSSAVAHVALFNDQPNREKESTGYSYKKPAIFVEPIFSEGKPIGNRATSYELTFKLLVQIEHLNTEGSLDEPLVQFDLKDSLHRVLNCLKLPNCSPLFASGKAIDTNHGNQYLLVLEYSTHFIDLTSTVYDDQNGILIEETIVNPVLVIGETFGDIIDPTPCVPLRAVETLDILTDVSVQVNLVSNELEVTIQATYVDGIDGAPEYTIQFDAFGPFEAIPLGEKRAHRYTGGGIYQVTILGSLGSIVSFNVFVNNSSIPEIYPVAFHQVITYDLFCAFHPNYPCSINTYLRMSDGPTLTGFSIQEITGNVFFQTVNPNNFIIAPAILPFKENAFTTYYKTPTVTGSFSSTIILNLQNI